MKNVKIKVETIEKDDKFYISITKGKRVTLLGTDGNKPTIVNGFKSEVLCKASERFNSCHLHFCGTPYEGKISESDEKEVTKKKVSKKESDENESVKKGK